MRLVFDHPISRLLYCLMPTPIVDLPGIAQQENRAGISQSRPVRILGMRIILLRLFPACYPNGFGSGAPMDYYTAAGAGLPSRSQVKSLNSSVAYLQKMR